MYFLNKAIGFLIDPLAMAVFGLVLAAVIVIKSRRVASGLMIFVSLWLWLWSMPLMTRFVGASLESTYLADGCVSATSEFPPADVIILHGGGMGGSEKLSDGKSSRFYEEMWTSADRVWMAARLWQAKKAPIILSMGGKVSLTTGGLLEDFGVPTNAVVFAEAPRNTEEEAKFVAEFLKQRFGDARPRVLVVTSAWHMRRAMVMYDKYAPTVEAIAAPCDFENTLAGIEPLEFNDFLPSADALRANCVALHEWVGILGYKYVRK